MSHDRFPRPGDSEPLSEKEIEEFAKDIMHTDVPNKTLEWEQAIGSPSDTYEYPPHSIGADDAAIGDVEHITELLDSDDTD